MNRSTLSNIGTAAFLLFLSTLSLQPQSCIGELKPLKPLACQDAAPICLCDESGGNCRWIWSCAPSSYGPSSRRAVEPSQRERPAGGIDTSIYQMLQPPVDTGGSLLDKAIQIQTLRNLQRQNEMIERMNQAPPVVPPTSFVPDEVRPTPARAPRSNRGVTNGSINGATWSRSSETTRLAYLAGYTEGIMRMVVDAAVQDQREGKDTDAIWKQATTKLAKYQPAELRGEAKAALLNRFYSDPQNLPIPLNDALEILAMKENGASQEVIDSRVAKERDAASREK